MSATCQGHSQAYYHRISLSFLMGLNDSYDIFRSQILVLDALPLVNMAYSMILRVEKHRAVQGEMSGSAMLSKER